MIYEFDKTYTYNPSDPDEWATGSGVFLDKDITLDLTFTDRLGNSLNNVRQITDSPFLDKYDISIIDTGGALIYDKYKSGYRGSYFTFTENENIAVFNQFKKEFGFRIDVFDKTNPDIYRSQLYLYGNPLEIDFLYIRDGNGYYLYNSGWTGEVGGPSGHPAYSGEKQNNQSSTGKMVIDITMLNDPRYTKYDKIDIYYGTSSGVRNNIEDFYKTIHIIDQAQEINFDINLDKLQANIGWWFFFVPWGKVCPGSGWLIGPHVISVPEPPEQKCICEQICIPEGDCEANLNVETGAISEVYTKVHTLDTGTYRVFDYIFETTDTSGVVSSSRLMITQTGVGYAGFSIQEYAISEENRVDFRVNNLDLEAKIISGQFSPANYCFFRTQLG